MDRGPQDAVSGRHRSAARAAACAWDASGIRPMAGALGGGAHWSANTADHPMAVTLQDQEPPDLIGDDPAVELSSNRTSLSFERTRMSADRTLMSSVRTSLSLISFGFTIHEVFAKASPLVEAANAQGRRLGLALLSLGVLVLVMGLVSHGRFERGLAERRQRLFDLMLLRTAPRHDVTPTYVSAFLLLAIGLLAIADIAFKIF
jgi:putative membrane protein